MPAALPFRLARAAVFAVVCTGLGVLAHVFGGGAVSAPVAGAGLVLAFSAAFTASGRERGFCAVLALLAGLQLLLHLLFTFAHAAGPLDPVHVAGGHGHSGLVPGLGMLVMHGWAVALTAVWLARGEGLLWALLRRLAVRLRLVWPAAVEVPFHAARHREPALLRSAVLRHSLSGRAPPSLSNA